VIQLTGKPGPGSTSSLRKIFLIRAIREAGKSLANGRRPRWSCNRRGEQIAAPWHRLDDAAVGVVEGMP
jgi:hypothetical protein